MLSRKLDLKLRRGAHCLALGRQNVLIHAAARGSHAHQFRRGVLLIGRREDREDLTWFFTCRIIYRAADLKFKLILRLDFFFNLNCERVSEGSYTTLCHFGNLPRQTTRAVNDF